MTNKNKNIILILGFLLSLVICYQLAIVKTIEQKNEYYILKDQQEVFKNLPSQIAVLKQKKKHYDSILKANRLEGNSVQNNLLKTINTYAKTNQLKVINFLEPHIINNNNLTVKTYEFTIEGDYSGILNLVYQLEQKTKFGEVINLHFEKKKNYRTGRNYLHARVLLKSFG